MPSAGGLGRCPVGRPGRDRYRSRTSPETSPNVAFFANTPSWPGVGPSQEGRTSLRISVFSHGFTVDWDIRATAFDRASTSRARAHGAGRACCTTTWPRWWRRSTWCTTIPEPHRTTSARNWSGCWCAFAAICPAACEQDRSRSDRHQGWPVPSANRAHGRGAMTHSCCRASVIRCSRLAVLCSSTQ